MSVRKYRRVEDVPEVSPSATPLHGLAAACALSELSGAMGRACVAPRGIRRFTSIEEADAHRRSWEMPPRAYGPG